MSDTPLPPDPYEGDDSPFEGTPFDGDPAGADAFFGGLDDAAFEPALDAADFEGGTFSEGADVYFDEAPAEAAPEAAPEAETALAEAPEVSGDGAVEEALVAAPATPARRRRAKKGAKGGRSRGSQQLVLGVNVTPTHVYGVLLRDEGDGGYSAAHTLVRRRTQGTEDTSGAMTPADVGLADLSADDATVQFGAGQELDFTGEFDGIVGGGETGIDMGAIGQPRVAAQPIVFELKDMLEEIEQLGHERPSLAFSLAPPDVEYAEVLVPEDKKRKAKKGKKGKKGQEEAAASVSVKRDKLVSLLPPPQPGREIDTDRVAFVPMTSREGRPRYLALIPQPTDPVVPALSMLREQSKHRRTAFKAIEAEVPLLMGMAGLVCPAEPHENTAVVRVGTEDTLVLLLSGGQLHHMEPMQSVTAYDGPDTICSRVLLQQDVQGVGTVHNVIVLSDEREDDLVQGFSAFYPDARVASFGELLAGLGITGAPEASGEEAPALAPHAVEAAGAALAVAQGKGGPFEDANLLPKALRKKKSRLDLSFGWHTLVVAVLLFLSVVFFVGLYFAQNGEIAERERRLAEFPPEATLAAPQLQLRIDSLRAAQAQITQSLAALDSLLYGTDRWSQDLSRTARAASAAGGTWFEEFSPGSAAHVIRGYSTSRARVVSIAQRLGGTIEEVTFQDVRGYPVYEWRILVPSLVELPQTARYLREQLGEPIPPPRAALDGLDAAPPGVLPDEAPPPAPAASGAEPTDS